MRLIELLEEQGMNHLARVEVDVTGMTADSRAVQPGFLFAALTGAKVDGRDFISDAIARGASAVLAAPGATVNDPRVRLIIDSNPRRRFALLASRFYGAQPATIAAVTGTNGKTSTVRFTEQLWTHLGLKAGSVGTLGAHAPGLSIPGSLTTPDPVKLHQILAEFARAGVTHLAMEASSHGLHQFRMDGVRIAIGGFTTLARDHLDYHGSVAAYLAAKLRLFSDVMIPGGTAVLNADNAEYPAFEAAARPRGHRILSYGRDGEDLKLVDARLGEGHQDLDLAIFGKPYRVRLPLAGAFQVSNALCALGVVIAGGADVAHAVAALEKLEGIPGRMERVGITADGATVYVDYAHTPDAIETALAALRPHTRRKLVIVFGCGGDRDRGKRRIMGERAQVLADAVYVTDDNPRSENAAAIRAEVLQGAPNATEIGDRAEAIASAIAGLEAGDVLLVAGKGHETGQIVGDRVIPFDDREIARAALKERRP